MQRLVLVLVVWLSSTTASAATLAGEVLVWQDATLYVTPDDKGDSITFGAFVKPREQSTGMVMQMRVVADRGDLIEVVHAYSTCNLWGSIDVDSRLDGMHFFVRRTDLAPVVIKPWSETYSDGTRISLDPGVPVSIDAKARTIALSLSGGKAPASIPVAIPDDHVGYAFTPPPDARSMRYTGSPRWEVTTRTVTLNGKPFTLDHALPLVVDVTYRGAVAALSFDWGCEALDVTVAKKQVRKYKSDGGLFGGLIGNEVAAPKGPIIAKGSALSTRSGRRVATARFDIETPNRCVDFAVRIERRHGKHSAATLPLCAAELVRPKNTP
jgi:hypothetical protein